MRIKLLSLSRKGVALMMAAIVLSSALFIQSFSASAAADDTYDINSEVNERFTAESLVLLKNSNSVLPVKKDKKVAVFGSAQVNTFYTPFGSGSTAGLGIGFIDTLSTLKKSIQVDSALEGLYRNFAITNPPDTNAAYYGQELLSARSIPEMPLSDKVVSDAAKRTDSAIVFIGRTNGEGYDWQLKDEYQLRSEELNMINLVTSYYNNVTVVLNTAAPIDMSWDSFKINAILWVGLCGEQGADAISDVISGKVNPSGKLTQTWPKKYSDTPTSNIYDMTKVPAGLHGPEAPYEEDIYAGYRYYDSFNVTPRFEFGFGLSYTTFKTDIKSVTADQSKATVKAVVQNTGKLAGKEVVQVYYSAPDGKLEKPYQQLTGFAKTDLLQPGEKQELTITYNTAEMASYDEENAQKILEKGDYIIRVGNSSRNTHIGAVLILDKTVITEQLSNQMAEPITINRMSSKDVNPYTYEEEGAEISSAKRISLSASKFTNKDNANTITDEPDELDGSVAEVNLTGKMPATTVNFAKIFASGSNDSVISLPSKIYCADLGTDFADFIVNSRSGDIDGYKSVTVRTANTEMPFSINPQYDGTYSATLRYFIEQPSAGVQLKDQGGRVLGTFNLNAAGKWADVSLKGLSLNGVTEIRIVPLADNITLNWLGFKSETYSGIVNASFLQGTYGQDINVVLYNPDQPDSTIYYTTDGSSPTTSSTKYTSPIAVNATKTIKAIAVKSGLKNSDVSAFSYTIEPSSVTAKADKPSISFYYKSDNGTQTIIISAKSGMSIFYTTDGTTPSDTSNYYTGPISVSAGTTIKAVAIGAGYNYSDVATVKIANVSKVSSDLETLGTYEVGNSVSLTADSGSTIYYTTSKDGTVLDNPTEDSTKYTGTIKLDTTGKTIIKAVAIKPTGMSDVATFVYSVVDQLYTLEDVHNGTATISQVVAQMTLSELVEAVTSAGKSTRFKSPSVSYADGPLGVKAGKFTKWSAPSLLACSWDVNLFAEQGKAVGKEMVESGIDFWLAPGVNILRDPRSGRNCEYFSEDPVLSGVLAGTLIIGVQSENVGCVVKHYVGNDQETNRKNKADSVISERALREIYLKAFEIVVKTSQPWGLMTTYCDVNRIATATDFELCTAIARGEWDFEGIIMTDWGCYADNAMMVYAGNDIIMPSGDVNNIITAVLNPDSVNKNDPNYTKPTTKAMLQRNVVNIFNVMVRTNSFARLIGKPQTYRYSPPEEVRIVSGASGVTISVSVTAGKNGTVTPQSQEIVKGIDTTFTVTPSSGYTINNIITTPRTEYELTENKLTLKNVENNTAINITFKAIPPEPDTASLISVIELALNKLDGTVLGGSVGSYLHSSANTLLDAINSAKIISKKSRVTSIEIEYAILALKQAINNFESSKLKVITHEISDKAVNKINAVDYWNASPVIGSEDCSDVDGGLNTIGTYKDTYLEYKIDVEKSGVYSFSGRISTTVNGAGFTTYVDGKEAGTINQKIATGGWQNWANSDTLRVELTEGLHNIKVVPLKSGINFNWFSIEPRLKNVSVTTGTNGKATPANQEVEQGVEAAINIIPNSGYMVDQVKITPDTDYTLKNNLLIINQVPSELQINITFKTIPTSPEFTQLKNSITKAQNLLDNAVIGGQSGNYTRYSIRRLTKIVKETNEIALNTSSTAIEVDDAIRELEKAVSVFKNSALTRNYTTLSKDTNTTIKAVDHSSASSVINSEECHDVGGGRNPTFTETNTWLSYEVAVVDSGIYNFISRVSVNEVGAAFQVLIDDMPVAAITQTLSTGGWQNWVTNDTVQIPLIEGVHTITIFVTKGGLNFNWFELSMSEPINMESAYEVMDIIDDLPAIVKLDKGNPEHVSAVQEARASYEELSTLLKEQIGNLQRLIAAEEKLQKVDEYILGDVNGDGDITVTDIVKLRAIIMGESHTEAQFRAGDITKDNNLTVTDIVSLRAIIMGN